MTQRPETYYTDQRPESLKTREILSRLGRVSKYETQSLIMTLYENLDSLDLDLASPIMTGSLYNVLWYLSQLSDNLSDPESLSTNGDFISETLESFSLFLSKESDRLSLQSPETLETLERLRKSMTRLSFSVLAIYTLYDMRETVSKMTQDLERMESLIGLTVSLEDLKPRKDPEALEALDNGAK